MKNEFKVGDTVKMSNVGKKQYQDAKYNPYDLTGVITKIDRIIVKWSNEETNSYDPRHIELVEPKQEQYYTSIPKDVKVGDKFQVISETGYKDKFKWAGSKKFPLGSIVTLDYEIPSDEPRFVNSNGDGTYLNWGCLKPVKENVVTAHLADIPPKTLIERTTEPTDVQQFSIGDEVELVGNLKPIVHENIGSKGFIIVTDDKDYIKVKFEKQTQYCKPEQLKLINNKTTNNNGKVHNNNNPTGNQSITLHGVPASIICGTTPRGETISCPRAEIKLGN